MCIAFAQTRGAAVGLLAALIGAAGCSSIKSRLYDGDGCGGRDAKCLHGIPTTIDVPTHVKIEIVDTHYYKTNAPAAPKEADKKEGGVPVAGKKPEVGVASVGTTRRLAYDLVRMKELYTVDFKRPAAGKNDLKLTFAPDVSGGQYFQKVEHTVEDMTIEKVTGLINSVINATPTLATLGKAAAKADPEDKGTQKLVPVDRLVAVEFFDIRHPNLAGEIQAFLEHHVNACSTCPTAGIMPGGTVPVAVQPRLAAPALTNSVPVPGIPATPSIR